MVDKIHYRWDFVGLSTDVKPTPATSPKVVDGSTYYCSDNSKLYVFYKDTWYERKPLGGGGGGGSYTAGTGIDITDDTISVDTTTIQEKLTAGTNVNISDNTISATDTTYSNFTGTDGTAAGVAGLVPAPATTDAGKFLKADGTWDTAGGGGEVGKAKVLTTADYNWNTSTQSTTNPNCIAFWLLDDGIYTNPSNLQIAYTQQYAFVSNSFVITTAKSSPYTYKYMLRSKYENITGAKVTYTVYTFCLEDSNTFNGIVLTSDNIRDNLTSSEDYLPLSAKQGKVLKDLVDSIAFKNAGAPTTATVGTVGQLLEDTTNGKLYICTAVSGSTYTWTEVGAGGGSNNITVLTSADYDYPDGNPTSVAAWRLPPGMYTNFDGTNIAEVWLSTTTGISTFAGSTFVIGEHNGAGNNATIPFVNLTTKSIGYLAANGSSASTNLIPSVVQSTGTSQTDVMSQNAVTSMVYADPSTKKKVQIGEGALASGTDGTAVGYSASAGASNSVAIGKSSSSGFIGSVALGAGSAPSASGVVSIGDDLWQTLGYNSSQYRLLTGVYDPQSSHDAATKGYVDPTTDSSAPTTATVGRLGQIQIDTTNADAYMCVAVDTVTPSYTWKKINA